MRNKYAITLVMITIICSSTFSVTDSNYQITANESIEFQDEKPVISDGPVPIEPLDLNIIGTNPSFEEVGADGIPTNYYATASAYQNFNTTYADEVATGNYACLVEAEGTYSTGATGFLRNSAVFSPEATIAEGLQMSFKWNTLANPDIHIGTRVYLSIVTTNSTGDTQWLYYYLSHSNIGYANSSTTAHFLMNDTLNQWNDFDRNITEDYVNVGTLGSFDSSRYIQYTYFYAYSFAGATGRIQVVLDDILLTNGTYVNWYENGDFEAGTEGGWYSYRSATGYVSRSNDSTHGSYSGEIHIPALEFDATAQCSLYRTVAGTPQGYYATSPNSTIIEFDWFYNDTPGLTDQYSYLDVRIQEGTTGNHVYFFLGHGNDSPSVTNTSTDKYVNLANFGTRGTWNHAVIDLYDCVMMFGSTDMCLYALYFEAYAAEIGCSVTTRVDNLQVLTDAAGGPGFEIDYWPTVDTPFTGWYRWTGETGVLSKTSDSHRGSIAANMTVESDDEAGIRRPTSVNLDPDLFTNFWWRLDNISETGAGWAYIEISFNNSRFLTYRLGHSSLYTLPGNTSTTRQIIVDNFNETGVWHNLVRNMTYDVTTAFGSANFIMTRIIVNTYAGVGGRTSLIVDDFNFMDGAPPVFSSVTIMTDPILATTPVEVRIVIDDIRPGVHRVDLVYSFGTGWNFVEGVYDENGWYTGFIPTQVFGTEVHFFVAAADGSPRISIDTNGTSYYNYTVTDVTHPLVVINTPLNDSGLEGTVPIATTATDAESDIAYVEIWIDSSLLANLTTAPFDYPWNTDLETPGQHTIEVIAYNNAGLSSVDSVVVLVLEPSLTTTTSTTTTPTSTTSTTHSPTAIGDWRSMIVPLTLVAVSLVVFLYLIVRGRKKK